MTIEIGIDTALADQHEEQRVDQMRSPMKSTSAGAG